MFISITLSKPLSSLFGTRYIKESLRNHESLHTIQAFVETTVFSSIILCANYGRYISDSFVTTNSISKAKRDMRPLCLFCKNYEQALLACVCTVYARMTELVIIKKKTDKNIYVIYKKKWLFREFIINICIKNLYNDCSLLNSYVNNTYIEIKLRNTHIIFKYDRGKRIDGKLRVKLSVDLQALTSILYVIYKLTETMACQGILGTLPNR